eukprot:m.96071 g.96071  ORF g.96071 m.96071 type:complete len:341 (+) comp12349_c0_seq3:152-1174(+)
MSGFHVPGHHVAAPPRSPQLSDAASFVATVKTQAPESYATFLDVLNQYQTGQLDVIAVQVRMELMFARHTHLVVGFREFLPENTERVSYWTVQTHRHLATEVKAWVLNLLLCAQRFFARSAQHASQAVRAVPPLSSALWRNILMGLKFSDFCWNTPPPRGKPQQKLKVSDALNYIDLVRTTFADDPSVYNSFLDAMRDFKQSLIDTPGVIRAVGVLFKGREDLISGFKIFLPPGWLMYPRETRCLGGSELTTASCRQKERSSWSRCCLSLATTRQWRPQHRESRFRTCQSKCGSRFWNGCVKRTWSGAGQPMFPWMWMSSLLLPLPCSRAAKSRNPRFGF